MRCENTEFIVHGGICSPPTHVVVARLEGKKIGEMLRDSSVLVSGDCHALDSSRTYRVACIDYIARQGYGMPKAQLDDMGYGPRETLIEYLTTK